jgi:hypothetical protein
MVLILKKVRHMFLFAGGGVLAVAVVWLVIYMFRFLLSNLSRATIVESVSRNVIRFDTEGFEKLNLMKK